MFSDAFASGLWIIPVLAVLILVHEFGHYFAARRCGVKVEEFGIGIPPRLFGWTRNGVIWSINAIPFGGFVRVKGEDGANMESDSMNAKPPLQRAFFLAAGAGMNIIFAVLLMVVVLGIKGDLHQNIYISQINPGSPAALAGWQPGDRIVKINGEKMESTTEVSNLTRDYGGRAMSVTIERRGELVETTVTPRDNPPKGEGRVGVLMAQENVGYIQVDAVTAGSAADLGGIQVGDQFVSVNDRPIDDFFALQTELTRFSGSDATVVIRRGEQLFTTTLAIPNLGPNSDVFNVVGLPTLRAIPVFERIPWTQVVPRGFQESFKATKSMIQQIRTIFTDRDALKQVAGPVGMGQITSQLIRESPLPVWYVLAQLSIILSLNLAILNLLPLPALDGGRLFFVLIELVRGGRKIAPEKEGLVHFAGLVILIGLMFFIAFRDVDRILGGHSFLP
ncbi:MAG TPA: site-2 protease family protein [Thermomicrobiales bacterium]|nr:site-2 protease family protein [Thermomicrobiales bacterium]